jgi:GTPase SAR1 family protein
MTSFTKRVKTNAHKGDSIKLHFVQVGDSGVGKSCLLEKLVDLTSNNAFISTIGVDIRTHMIQVDGKTVKLQVGRRLYRNYSSCCISFV